ncbi:LysE family translocator [Flindersiella endophytica]
MSTTVLLGFLLTVAIAHAIPGPDFALILRHASRGGRYGRSAAFGVLCGLCVHVTAAALGLSALLARSATVFTVVKLIGAAFLVYLGVHALLASRKPRDTKASAETAPEPAIEAEPNTNAEPNAPTPPTPTGSRRKAFVQGFVGNVLNPKAALFFLSLLPQFIDGSMPVAPQVLVLGVITVLSALVWWMLFVALVDRIRGLLARGVVRRTLDRITGLVFIGLAVRLARMTT